MIQTIRNYMTSERGVAYIEFAFILPILLLLFVGSLELTRFVMANQKVDKASHGLANFLSMQDEPLNVDVSVLNTAFDSLIRPFDTSAAGFRVLELRPDLANLDADGYPLLVEESKTSGAAGATRIGDAGSPVSGAIVRDIRIEPSEYLVGVETYFTYTNIVPGMARALGALGFSVTDKGGSQLYKRSVVRHRLANFELLTGTPTDPQEPICCGTYCDDPAPSCACGATPRYTCRIDDGNDFANCTYRYCPPRPPNPCIARGDCPPPRPRPPRPPDCRPDCGGGGG